MSGEGPDLRLVAGCDRDLSRAASTLVDIGLRLSQKPRATRCGHVPLRPEHGASERRQPPGAPAGTQGAGCTDRRGASKRSRCHTEPGGDSC
jgi:hypothetical protein